MIAPSSSRYSSRQRRVLKINQDDVTMDKLQGRLEDIFKTRAEKVAFVKG